MKGGEWNLGDGGEKEAGTNRRKLEEGIAE
jgi:hypothetical protein